MEVSSKNGEKLYVTRKYLTNIKRALKEGRVSKKAINILCTTGLTLILLAVVEVVFSAHFLCVESIFQVFAVNIIIHIGLLFTRKFESSYSALEFALDIGYVSPSTFFRVVFHPTTYLTIDNAGAHGNNGYKTAEEDLPWNGNGYKMPFMAESVQN